MKRAIAIAALLAAVWANAPQGGDCPSQHRTYVTVDAYTCVSQ